MRLSKKLQELFEQAQRAQAPLDLAVSPEQTRVLFEQAQSVQVALQQSGAIEAAKAVEAILRNTGLFEDTHEPPLPTQLEPTQPKKKRGNQYALTEEQERTVAAEWLRVKGTELQHDFCQRHGVAPATLGRYVRKHFPNVAGKRKKHL